MSLFDDLEPPAPPAPPEPPAPPAAKPAREGPTIHSVSGLVAAVRQVLADTFPEVWVRGEIAGFKHYESGHMYFSLKDADASLSCVHLKFAQRGLRFRPHDGLEVEARGRLNIYAPRGQFQLDVLEMRPAGMGALLLAFEALKRKLAAEGLFDAARKRPLPAFAASIGIVTSPSGAVIRDIVHVLRRRWPGRRKVLVPVPVQGPGAAEAIARGIERLNALGGLDVLIVGRGGGSLEDLWAFNEEVVVRAVAASRIPVLSAVGHEVDVTLCDLAADVRAATPSAAAELLTTPTRAEIAREARRRAACVHDAMMARLADARDRLDRARGRYGFRRADDLIVALAQTLDAFVDRLVAAARARLADHRADLRALGGRVHPGRLVERVANLARHRGALEQRLALARLGAHGVRLQRVAAARARLTALSPRGVLARGYSLVTRPGGGIVVDAAALRSGDPVALEFARGRAAATITSTAPDPGAPEEP